MDKIRFLVSLGDRIRVLGRIRILRIESEYLGNY